MKHVEKSYAFDFNKLNQDIINKKITEESAHRIWTMYTDFTSYLGTGQYNACVQMFNTLELSGYYVDYDSLKRSKTIKGVIEFEEGIEFEEVI